MFVSLLGISIGITSSPIINKSKKKHDKKALLAKSKLSSTEVLNSEALHDSVISSGGFVLANNVLKEYNEIKEEIKN